MWATPSTKFFLVVRERKTHLTVGVIFSSYTFLQCRGFLGSMEKSMIFYTRHFSTVWCTTSLCGRKKLNYFSSSLAENQFFMGVGVAFLQCGMAAPQILIPALHKCILSVHSNFQYEDLSYACNLFFFAHLAVDRLILLLQILCPIKSTVKCRFSPPPSFSLIIHLVRNPQIHLPHPNFPIKRAEDLKQPIKVVAYNQI